MMYIRPAYQYAGVKKVDPWLLYIKQSIRAALCSYFWIFMEEYSCLQLTICLFIYPAQSRPTRHRAGTPGTEPAQNWQQLQYLDIELTDSRSVFKCQACLKIGRLTLGCRLSAGIQYPILVGIAGEGLVAKILYIGGSGGIEQNPRSYTNQR